MVIYLAGKITNEPDYRAKFQHVETLLKDKGHIVLSPAVLPEGLPYEFYIRVDDLMLMEADAICLLPNWTDSPGARRERSLAKLHHKLILYYIPDP